jgi:hypothetical protein
VLWIVFATALTNSSSTGSPTAKEPRPDQPENVLKAMTQTTEELKKMRLWAAERDFFRASRRKWAFVSKISPTASSLPEDGW